MLDCKRRIMKICSENAAPIVWRIFNPGDLARSVPFHQGNLSAGNSESFDHFMGTFQLEVRQVQGASVFSPTTLKNDSTCVYAADGAFHALDGVRLDEGVNPFTPEQVRHLIEAFQRFITGLQSCTALDATRWNLLSQKLAGGLHINQDAIFATQKAWALSAIGGRSITLDTVETWSSQRLPLLTQLLAHEFLHLIGEQHNDPAIPYASTIFHQFELCYP
jgi:hypothetical protein